MVEAARKRPDRPEIMMRNQVAEFRGRILSSLLRSAPLKEARAQRGEGRDHRRSAEGGRRSRDRGHPSKQEGVGLQSITDGEFRRAFWNYDFLGRLAGMEAYLGERKIAFQVRSRNRCLRVTGKLWNLQRPSDDRAFRIRAGAHKAERRR